MTDVRTQAVDFYTTCPPFRPSEPAEYIRRVSQVSRWSDEAGCKGILVYTDNGLLDPWIVAQIVLQNSEQLMPLVAVQPIYMHAYTVAKMVATLSYLYQRRICLNMVAGGFKNDLIALHDLTPHDQRYERLVEYTTIIQRLLAGGSPVTFHGKFYSVERLALTPAVVGVPFECGRTSGAQWTCRSIGARITIFSNPPFPRKPGATEADPTPRGR